MNGSHSRVSFLCMPSILTTARTGPLCSTVTFLMSLVNSGKRRTPGVERSSSVHTRRPSRATTRPSIVIVSMKCRPLLRNAALQLAGVDIDCLRGLRDLDAGPRGRRSRCEAERTARARDRGEPGELDRSVRPIGQRPRLQRQRLAVVRRERKRLRTCHRSTRPRHTPTDSGLHARRRAVQPSDRHRPVPRLRLLLHRRRRGGARQNSNCTTSCDFHVPSTALSTASLHRRVASALKSMCGSSDTGPSYPISRSARKCAA